MNDLRFQSKNRRGGFTQVDNSVIRSTRLTMQAKCLYAQLLAYAWGGSVFPGRERLAKENNVHPNTIDKHMKELKDIGLIQVTRRGFGKTNLYTIMDITDAVYENLHVSRFTSECDTDSQYSVTLDSHPSVNKEDEVKKDEVLRSVVSVDVFQEYESRWGILPPASTMSLAKYVQEGFEPQLIVAVMDVAQKKSKRWNYAAGILDNLEHEHNIKTLDAYQKLNKRPTTRKQAAPVADRANF